jgi:hypothetical protein
VWVCWGAGVVFPPKVQTAAAKEAIAKEVRRLRACLCVTTGRARTLTSAWCQAQAAERREQEELELALALSMSESEARKACGPTLTACVAAY